jgi:hypothetical protein
MADDRWWIFVGNAGAVAAIARRIARLPAGARVAVVVEADAFPHALARVGGVEPWVLWCAPVRAAAASCAAQALRTLHVPPGRGRIAVFGPPRAWTAARAAWRRRPDGPARAAWQRVAVPRVRTPRAG